MKHIFSSSPFLLPSTITGAHNKHLVGPTVHAKTYEYIFPLFTSNIWSYLLWSPRQYYVAMGLEFVAIRGTMLIYGRIFGLYWNGLGL